MDSNSLLHPAAIVAEIHLVFVIAISIRVIMRRPNTGVALSWLFLVGAVPYAGAFFYLLLGERRISKSRARSIERRQADYAKLVQLGIDRGITNVDWDRHPQEARGMDRLGIATVGFPTVSGSCSRMFSKTDEILSEIAQDVDAAEKSVLMEFYIWNQGGLADDVLAALIRAAQRGVVCRVLIDHVGAGLWWKSDQPKQLRDAGVKLRAALPVGVIRSLFDRTDLRLHRKIVVIDGKIAWTGSMNLVDPKFFKQEAKVGDWVDAMIRVEGSIVAPLTLTVIGDWSIESGEALIELIQGSGIEETEQIGNGDAQVVPSGPGESDDCLLQMLLANINSAHEELILTTPYFVPDESMLRALRGAAGRGVSVHLVVPEKVDSIMTRYASRSYYGELMELGVKVYLYNKGLLHTKSITADRHISMFGTVNLDMRSIWINYEVAVFLYGSEFGEHLVKLQRSYIDDSIQLDSYSWARRSRFQQFLENTFRLMSPIL